MIDEVYKNVHQAPKATYLINLFLLQIFSTNAASVIKSIQRYIALQ